MRKVILLCLILIYPALGKSQIITFTDSSTGKALEMVYVIGEKPDRIAISNFEGQIDLDQFQNVQKILIQRIGYRSINTSYRQLTTDKDRIIKMISSVTMATAIVSASRWAQPGYRIPSKVTVITPRESELMNPQTAADLLGISGEVFIQKSQQGGGSPMIRGFSANRLLYAVDGVRMNTAIFRAGNLQNVISLDPFAIEHTEVLFGPGSILYGSDAIGGVMSFQTLSPQLSLSGKPLVSGKAIARFSSANKEKTFHFDVNSGGKKWASRTSISYSDFDDLMMGKFGPKEYLKNYVVVRTDSTDQIIQNNNPEIQAPSGYNQINITQKFKYQPGKYLNFNYAFHYSETSEYSRYDRLIETDEKGLPVAAVWNYGPQKWMMNHFNLNYSKKNKLFDLLALRIALQHFEESRIDRRFNQNRLRTQVESVNAPSVNIDLEKSHGRHRIYYGAEYVFNRIKSKGTAIDISNNKPIEVADRYPDSDWKSYAAYLNYQYNASEYWTIQGGIRYNSFKINSDFSKNKSILNLPFNTFNINKTALSGSIGVVFTPVETWKLSLNGSSGFRAPNVDDIGKLFEFSEGEITVPNTNISAEYAYNTEINVSKVWKEIFKIDVSVYYTLLDNAMVRRPFNLNGKDSVEFNGVLSKVHAIQNAASAYVYGINAGLEMKLPSGFGIHARYNYQIGEEEMETGEKSPSRHAAPAFGQLAISYQNKGLEMRLYMIGCNELSFAQLNEEEKTKPFIYALDPGGNPYSPGWYTLNMKIRREISADLSISAGIENITNQRYRPYSSGLAAPGRNFVISFSAQF